MRLIIATVIVILISSCMKDEDTGYLVEYDDPVWVGIIKDQRCYFDFTAGAEPRCKLNYLDQIYSAFQRLGKFTVRAVKAEHDSIRNAVQYDTLIFYADPGSKPRAIYKHPGSQPVIFEPNVDTARGMLTPNVWGPYGHLPLSKPQSERCFRGVGFPAYFPGNGIHITRVEYADFHLFPNGTFYLAVRYPGADSDPADVSTWHSYKLLWSACH